MTSSWITAGHSCTHNLYQLILKSRCKGHSILQSLDIINWSRVFYLLGGRRDMSCIVHICRFAARAVCDVLCCSYGKADLQLTFTRARQVLSDLK